MTPDLWDERTARVLWDRFGGPVELGPAEVGWDGRAVGRVVLPGGAGPW